MRAHTSVFRPMLRTLCALLLAGALLLCAGCGQGRTVTTPASAPENTSPPTQVTSSPEPAPEPAPKPERSVLAAPVVTLTALTPDSLPSFGALENGSVLVCWTDYGEEEQDTATHCALLDPAEDAVLRTATLPGGLSLIRTCSDGTGLLFSYQREQYYLLDETLQVTPLQVPVSGGQFSRDGSRYYFVEEEQLYQYDLSTGRQSRVELAQGLRLGGIDSITGTGAAEYLSGWIYPSLYSFDTCSVLLDPDSGQPLLLQQDMSVPYCYGDRFLYRAYDTDAGQNSLVWGALSSDAPLDRVDISPLEGDYAFCQLLPDSNYVFRIYDDSWATEENADTQGVERTTLYRLEEEGGVSCCPLEDYGLQDALVQSVYLPGQELILGSVYTQEGYRLYLIDPLALDFTDADLPALEAPQRVDQQIWADCLAELEVPDLSSDLLGVRDRADELEQRFGVHILLSSECADPCTASGYQVTTTDQAGWKNEALTISRALDNIEEALSNYPDDFFRQFCTDAQDSGIYLMLVGSITSDDPIYVSAFEFGLGAREYIGLDISFYELSGNLYHEIWHATENKIFRTDFSGFYDGSWDSCNPPGFEYRYEYNLSDQEGTLRRNTFTGGDQEVYFVDDYAKTYPKEDRARIMEYVMGQDSLAQSLLSSPAIRQKLALMDQGIRSAFDTSGWEEVRWLRFF